MLPLVAALLVPVAASPAQAAGCLRDTREISPLPCSEILATAPFRLTFGADAGKIDAGNGVGTGFTMVDPPTNGTGYQPENLSVATGTPGTLAITTDKGIAWQNEDAQQNALGVGIRPGRKMEVSTTIINPPKGSGQFEQAGLWWGNDQNFYVKFVVRSSPGASGPGTDLQIALEVNSVGGRTVVTPHVPGIENSRVRLILVADPFTSTVSASYTLNGGSPVAVGTVDPPPGMFSADAAGIDPTIGTNTFGGIFATHRNGAVSKQYVFDDFALVDLTPTTPAGSFSFDRFAIGGSVDFPSAMAFGPDGRLYVAEMLGEIHALTLDATHRVTSDQVIGSLGSRLTLGLAVDPASTASNVVLWVSHSDPDLVGPSPTTGEGGAPANSSAVAKITVNPTTRTATRVSPDPITGLPRSQANHSVNGLHFGPDGRLYIAVGSNTGAGAPNRSSASLGEFGLREEQPLTAALVVADVKASGFDGTCANTTNIYGAPPCSVTAYATGLRNAYDFVWHSNGSLYAPDNGAAVGPSYPSSPTPPCTGLAPYPENSPGTQNDILTRVQAGRYYGHPNPRRLPSAQCVFKDGSKQGVAPLSNYTGPISDLGASKSADGIIEYRSGAFNGALRGNLLITNYSVGDDVTRVVLSADGTSVTSKSTLAGNFVDPLPIVEGPDGTIYVGEHGANRITALVPSGTTPPPPPPPPGTGTWTSRAAMPVALSDAGGAMLDGKLYVVAGKTSSGPRRTLYVYSTSTNTWSTGPSLPSAYPAVENPAVVAYSGKLYVFGGSTAAFSGATGAAAVFDPATSTWTMLRSMGTARGGATAQVLGTKIYIAGGIGSDGASISRMSVFTPASNSWGSAPAMSTRRDNPGSAVLNGKFYVFGGRTRNADGTTPAGTLASVEAFDPASNTWQSRASMPTGRRSMAVGVIGGRAQVAGGEASSSGSGTFAQHEEYDPSANAWRALAPMLTPRHGTVAGTVGSVTYVAGGGPSAGSSYSQVTEQFTFD